MVKRLDNKIAAYSEIMRFLLLSQIGGLGEEHLCVTRHHVRESVREGDLILSARHLFSSVELTVYLNR